MPSTKKDDGRTLLGEGGYRVVGKKKTKKRREKIQGAEGKRVGLSARN